MTLKRARIGSRLIIGLVAVSMSASCASTGFGGNAQTSDYPTMTNTVKQACIGGVVAGVATTAVTNDDAGLGDYLLGAALGAAAGCTIGIALDNRRKQYATTADYYDAEIEITQKINSDLAQVNAMAETRIEAAKVELASLEEQKATGELDLQKAKALNNLAKADLAWAEKQLTVAKRELEAQTTVLEKAKEEEIEDQKQTLLTAEVQKLEAEVNALEAQVLELTSVQDAVGQYAA